MGQALFPESRAGALGTDSLATGSHLTTVPSKACFSLQHQTGPAPALVTALGANCPATRATGVPDGARGSQGDKG